ncbi:BTAD domain-containing putative transcriptional regulator [Streptomyces sp. Inha503]|uniref:BTAD domain-containing putative transcriptional regulator n=1 Tax=Streptomyces sp. Inha503 TaxID=3383314 RepID=UPI0039A09615
MEGCFHLGGAPLEAAEGHTATAEDAASAGLEERRPAAVEQYFELRLSLGETGELIGELRVLVSSHPVGAGNTVTLCDQVVFVDEATEPIVPGDRCGVAGWPWFRGDQRVWWPLFESSVWPVSVVVVRVLVDDEAEVVPSGDQEAVGGFAAA